ncbi:MAG: hypothetical protein RBR05_04315 [Candidatus Methanomethylophilaceae archaeon]|nr:hypothetical protein [Candidatus Methanomethylophilaceae archaeon]MDY0224604.1 hypothetical protein [Candidatus Methanomethylophilaceae archaeon]
MVPTYEETEFIIPRIAFHALLFILISTDAFILICTQLNIGTDMWMFYITTVIFAVIILIFYFIRLKIVIENDVITIKYLKKYIIPFSDIIDFKIGDVNIIKNYSGWGLKNIKFKNFICNGYENGISLKVMGRKIFTFSTSDPDHLATLLPKK